jgi:hypothetical protein
MRSRPQQEGKLAVQTVLATAPATLLVLLLATVVLTHLWSRDTSRRRRARGMAELLIGIATKHRREVGKVPRRRRASDSAQYAAAERRGPLGTSTKRGDRRDYRSGRRHG